MGACKRQTATSKVEQVDPTPLLTEQEHGKAPALLSRYSPSQSELESDDSVGRLKNEIGEALESVSFVVLQYVLEGDRVPVKAEDVNDFDVSLLMSRSELYSEAECAKYKEPERLSCCALLCCCKAEPDMPAPRVQPNRKEIVSFLRPFFTTLKLENECAIVMLIYIDRLILKGQILLKTSNWRPVLYTALLLASKCWEDLGCLNIDFTTLYPIMSLAALNRLEVQFTDALDWSFFIAPETYVKYYYALKDIHSHSPKLRAFFRRRLESKD